jgi:hypothetical protein
VTKLFILVLLDLSSIKIRQRFYLRRFEDATFNWFISEGLLNFRERDIFLRFNLFVLILKIKANEFTVLIKSKLQWTSRNESIT